ncbi:hypothetical protein [Photobacterium leiognathi]|uniref:hypothetical protein n=1 Tax=Photobacterium leiognathi TaxID=553611 RepID=UPI00020880CC|nr:hypothetical protein [Photobacterium leiognathi]PSW48337.1 hypothetical protein CTM83_20095 [Photobacterium leiognathi subsp. mandapamensis]GAA03228.1 conserved hypothetical protein [Photobacterium leiognathi subsp. mandapamensis svers.1.1.]
MAINSESLLFNIDLDELNAIKQSVGATQLEMEKAYGRALSRTSVTINKLALQKLRQVLEPRQLKHLRKRVKQFRVKQSGMDELKLWFGLNDIQISKLKGTSRRLGSRKKPQGAVFTPRSSHLTKITSPDGFAVKAFGKKSIFTRVGKGRWPIKEERIDIHKAAHWQIEDEVFALLPEIFIRHFTTDIKGRVAIRDK